MTGATRSEVLSNLRDAQAYADAAVEQARQTLIRAQGQVTALRSAVEALPHMSSGFEMLAARSSAAADASQGSAPGAAKALSSLMEMARTGLHTTDEIASSLRDSLDRAELRLQLSERSYRTLDRLAKAVRNLVASATSPGLSGENATPDLADLDQEIASLTGRGLLDRLNGPRSRSN